MMKANGGGVVAMMPMMSWMSPLAWVVWLALLIFAVGLGALVALLVSHSR
jgi:hypothetical protein